MKTVIKFVICIIEIIVIMILVSMFSANEKEKASSEDIILQEQELNDSGEIEYFSFFELNNRDRYYTVLDCVNKYIEYCKDKDKTTLINLLDNQYKEENNIKESNVLEYIHKLEETNEVSVNNIYVQNLSDNCTEYYVEMVLQNVKEEPFGSEDDVFVRYKTTKEYIGDSNVTIRVDFQNNTFSVIPNGYVTDKNGNLEKFESVKGE